MKITSIFQHIISSCLAISLLSIIFYTNTLNDPDEIENKLSDLSRQAGLLNLKINQTVFLQQFGVKKNYDLLSQQTAGLKAIQLAYKQSIKNLGDETITHSFNSFKQQVDQKIQLIEAFKSQHALYNSVLHFLRKTLDQTKNNPNSDPQLALFIQSLRKATFQNIYQNSVAPTTVSAQHVIDTIQQSSQFKTFPLLNTLTQHAQTVIIHASKSSKYATQITTDKTTWAFEQLDREISQYYIAEHKKSRAIQNILFLVAILAVTYIKSPKTK